MSDRSQPDERSVSKHEGQTEDLVGAVREAIEDWVAEDEITVHREGNQIIADEEELVQNISLMIAMAMDKAAE